MRHHRLFQQVQAEASAFGIIADTDGHEITLDTPEGQRFEADLHGLISSPWEEETFEDICRLALADVRAYGPLIEECPAHCSCKEG